MFPTFPSGWPGFGLFLLRLALCGTLVVQAVAYVVDWRHIAGATWTIALLAIASALSLLIGFLTPFAGILAGLITLNGALSWLPGVAPNPFDARLANLLAAVIAIAIVCLGPGALSLDARLFGRREIVIPNSMPPTKL